LESSLNTSSIQDAPVNNIEVNAQELSYFEPGRNSGPLVAAIATQPAHSLAAIEELPEVEMNEEVADNIRRRKYCPEFKYQPEFPSHTQSEKSSHSQSHEPQMSKGSGKGKDMETLKLVLRSKYPHPILKNYLIGSSEERRSRENHYNKILAPMVDQALEGDPYNVPQDDD
jgi:hypothetical protein